MTKTNLKWLEKLFAAEMDAAVDKQSHLVQSKSKALKQLADDGYCVESTETLSGNPPVKITGYELTALGRMTYCESC